MKWKKVKLGDICTRVCSGGTPKSSNGSYYSDSEIPWLNTKEVDFKDIYITEKYISQAGYDNSSAKWVEPNSVIVAMYGATAGKSCVTKIRLTTNQACCNLQIDESKADYRFVYCMLRSHYQKLASLAIGGAQQNLSLQFLKSYEIDVPPLSVQRKIAEILGAYDDAIENNRRRIELLEKMARSIYRSWFVNFARWEGDCPKEIKNGCLDNIVSRIGTGLNPRKNFVLGNGQNFYVTIKNMTDNTIVLDDKCAKIDDEAVRRINSRSDLRAGDLLFSGIGTIGRVAFIYETPKNWNTSESIFNLRPANGVTSEYLYFVLTGDETQAYVDSHALGVAQRGIRMADLRRCPVLLPSAKIMEDFTKIVKPYMTLQNSLRCMNQNLIRQRDRLLPRLMSGMIDLERFVEEEVANG